jgi:hypothetical protein
MVTTTAKAREKERERERARTTATTALRNFSRKLGQPSRPADNSSRMEQELEASMVFSAAFLGVVLVVPELEPLLELANRRLVASQASI